MNKFKYGSIITTTRNIYLNYMYDLFIENNQVILLELDTSNDKYTLAPKICYLVTNIFCEDI